MRQRELLLFLNHILEHVKSDGHITLEQFKVFSVDLVDGAFLRITFQGASVFVSVDDVFIADDGTFRHQEHSLLLGLIVSFGNFQLEQFLLTWFR